MRPKHCPRQVVGKLMHCDLRLLEEGGDPELGFLGQNQVYVTIDMMDFDGKFRIVA